MKYCFDCGFVGQPELYKPGTFQMEVGLWLIFLVPAVIYYLGRLSGRVIPGTFLVEDGLWPVFLVPGVVCSIWRLAARYQRCAKCGKKRIVPVNSQAAQDALRKLSPTPSAHSWFCMACGKPIFSGGRFCSTCEPVQVRHAKGES